MAHEDPHRHGAGTDPRRPAGRTGAASDAGKDKSEGKAGTDAHERRTDDVSQAPESGEKPEVMPEPSSPRR